MASTGAPPTAIGRRVECLSPARRETRYSTKSGTSFVCGVRRRKLAHEEFRVGARRPPECAMLWLLPERSGGGGLVHIADAWKSFGNSSSASRFERSFGVLDARPFFASFLAHCGPSIALGGWREPPDVRLSSATSSGSAPSDRTAHLPVSEAALLDRIRSTGSRSAALPRQWDSGVRERVLRSVAVAE